LGNFLPEPIQKLNMLSICVPVYNFKVVPLVKTLEEQATEAGIVFEIIVIDDCSTIDNKLFNNELASIKSVLYLELERNIGRSAIRNLFLKYTKFTHLLFLDCDSQISENQYLANYIKYMNNEEKVICGGRIYPNKQKNDRLYYLRWKYGVYRECIPAEKRGKNPYQSFMTNNFVIHRNVLEKIKFDEKLTGYGHEDSLFGFRLMQHKIPVLHIQNPVLHDYTETVNEFLYKTKQGLENLHFIHSSMQLGADFNAMIRLLKVYTKIKKNFLHIPIFIFSILLNPFIVAFFKFGVVSLSAFDFYKLSYYIKLDIKSTKPKKVIVLPFIFFI